MRWRFRRHRRNRRRSRNRLRNRRDRLHVARPGNGADLLAIVPAAAIPPGLLGRIQGGVGATDQGGNVLVLQQLGDAEAHGDLQFAGGRAEAGRLDGLPGPLQGADGLVGLGPRQHDRDLLAAVTGHEIAFPGRLAQDPRRAAQHFVAGLMSVGIVELLEMIDVPQDQREGPVAAAEFVQAGCDLVVEGPPVRQTGQGVGAGFGSLHLHEPRLFMELVLHGAELRLHCLIGLDQPRDGRDHALGFLVRADGQFLVDRFDPVAVLADIDRHVTGQVFQPRQDFLRQTLLFRQLCRSAAEGAVQHPTGSRSAGTHQDRKPQIAKHLKHNDTRFGGLFPPDHHPPRCPQAQNISRKS